jgi:hypothetical protein
MEKLSIEMPLVKSCNVENCGFNKNNNCHAKAITIGDYTNPGCDTFMNSEEHAQESVRIAGVGACKVSGCKYNKDFECYAENISVSFKKGKINCQTYRPA